MIFKQKEADCLLNLEGQINPTFYSIFYSFNIFEKLVFIF